MQVKEGDKVVVLQGPREGSILVFRVDSFEKLLEKVGAESMSDAAITGGGRSEQVQGPSGDAPVK